MYPHKAVKSGFTLIELLVVIAIIAMLASIILASLGAARIKARDARRIADLRQLQTAIEEYIGDNASSPETLAALVPQYIQSQPYDPSRSAANGAYAYGNLGGDHYCIAANLENAAPAGSATDCSTASGMLGVPALGSIPGNGTHAYYLGG